MKSPSKVKGADDIRSTRGSRLLPLHVKALLQCREHLLKSLNPEVFCNNKTPDGQEDERKCERLSQYLEHLEQGDDRSFGQFVELLREYNREAYNMLEQTIKSLEDEEDDESLQEEEIYSGERASMTGLAIRDLLKRHKFRTSDQSIKEFNFFDPETKSRHGYVECFVVASRGQEQHKSWIKHDKRRKVKDSSDDDNNKTPFMAILTKDLVFKLIRVADIPDLVNKPANCANAYMVDEKSLYSPATNSTQLLNMSNRRLSSSLKSSFKSDKMSNIHEESRKLQNVHTPPPLPPKPDSLSPLLSIRFRERFLQHNSIGSRMDDRASDTSVSLSGRSTFTLPPPIPAREKIENCVKPPPMAPPASSMFLEKEFMTMPQLSSYPKAYDSDHYHPDTDDGIDDDNISLNYIIEPEDGEEQYETIDQNASSQPTEKKTTTPAKEAADLLPPLPTSTLPPSSESLEKVYDIEKLPQTQIVPTNSEVLKPVTTATADEEVPTVQQPAVKTSSDASYEAAGRHEFAEVSVSRSSSGVSTTIKTRDSGFDSVVSHSLHESPLCAAEQTEDLDTIIPEPVDNQPTDSSGKLLNCAEPSYYEDIDLMNNEQTSHYLDPRPDEPDNDHNYSPSSSEQKVVTAGTLFMCECLPACKCESSMYNEYIEERKRTKLAAFKSTRICYDREGAAYYVQADELKRFGDPRGEPWFYPIPLSIKEATLFLRQEKQKGCFIVYQTVDVGDHVPEGCAYFLSLSGAGSEVVHYPIVENYCGDFMVEGHDRSFLNVCDLVQYFRRNKSCLLTRLRRPLKESRFPIIPGYHYPSNFELLRKSIKLHGKIISEGKFGLTCVGNYGRQHVFVKALQNDCITDEEDDFLNEALVLMDIEHENIIKLVGVCFKSRPFFILTEHFGIGTLKDSLSNGFFSSDKCDPYFDMCVQMVSAMVHLEKQRFVIHRNLSANNFLISSNYVVKLFNFERARRVDDDGYNACNDEDVPVRWSPPEVLRESFYTTKSDVWSLAVVFWELFSHGQLPYGSMSDHEVVVHVSERGRLEKPQSCDGAMFSIMVHCWKYRPAARPTFAMLESRLKGQCGLYFANPQRKFSDVASPLHSSASLSEDLPTVASYTLKKISSQSGPNTPLISTPTLNFRSSNAYSDYEARADDVFRSQNSTKHNRHTLSISSRMTSERPSTVIDTCSASIPFTQFSNGDATRGNKMRKSLRNLLKATKLSKHSNNTTNNLGQ